MKVILKMMIHKIVSCFSQFLDILKQLLTAWKSKGLFDKNIKPLSTSNNSLNPGINYFDNFKIRVKIDGNYLKQEKLTFTDKQVVNLYIVYEINCCHLLLVKILR